MSKKDPIVIDDNGELQVLQSKDRLSLEDEISYQRLLIQKLIFILVANGFDVPDKDLLNEL